MRVLTMEIQPMMMQTLEVPEMEIQPLEKKKQKTVQEWQVQKMEK